MIFRFLKVSRANSLVLHLLVPLKHTHATHGATPLVIMEADRLNSQRWEIVEIIIQLMTSGVHSDDFNLVSESVTWFREHLGKDHKPIQEVIDCGVVPRFVQLLSGQFNAPPDVQEKIVLEAAGALTNILVGEYNHVLCVVESGSIPIFVNLMTHPNAEIREQAILALGNVAGETPQLRNLVLEHNVLENLLAIVQKEIESPSANPHLGAVQSEPRQACFRLEAHITNHPHYTPFVIFQRPRYAFRRRPDRF